MQNQEQEKEQKMHNETLEKSNVGLKMEPDEEQKN